MALARDYPVRLICRATGWPRSSLYLGAAPPAGEAELRQALTRLAGEWPTYGYRRLTALLRREGWSVNAKRVRRVMAALGIAGKAVRRRVRTTDSAHGFPRYPNLVAGRPDHVWVADITYVRVRSEFVYLAVLLDVFTRRIRGWALSRSVDQSLTLGAPDRALAAGVPAIHHSDQGMQYAATGYVERLAGCGVAIGMAAVGVPEENGYAERLMRTIEEEEVELTEYEDDADARRQLGRFLDDVYNCKRIHSSLEYLTPAEFEQQWLTQQAAQTAVP
jgi:transposase InsO family protein